MVCLLISVTSCAFHLWYRVFDDISVCITCDTQCGPKFTDLIFYHFLTALLQMPSTRPQLKYVVEIVTHKSANWH